MSHELRVEQTDAWTWRGFCSCGYRSKMWDTADEAATAGARHLREQRPRRERPPVTHRTRVTPWRFV